jgi:endonuclease/exonuclease/phosphatase family metal-dependent hydrolase
MSRMIASAALVAALAFGALASGESRCAARDTAFVRWVDAAKPDERAALDRWCAAVGAPIRIAGAMGDQPLNGRFVVVSWNTHVGAADVDGFVADLRAGRLTGGAPVHDFVLLLQEAYRAGRDVPVKNLRDARWASSQRPPRATGSREDILTIVARLRLHTVYIPSMRNGAPLATDEDRGNAIVSTAPLSNVVAVELPLERQRRVAIQGVVHVKGGDGAVVPLTIVNTHFTNMVMHHLWLLSESGRYRQARALAGALPADGPLIVGGDFNAWFGFRDAAYKEMTKIAGPADDQDRRASFGPMRLDHVLFRVADGWKTTLRRADHRYGSDHYPLIATVDATGHR